MVDHNQRELIKLSPNTEALKFVAKRSPLNVNFLHGRTAWTMAAPANEFIQFGTVAFGNNFNRAVMTVHHPTGEGQTPRLFDSGGAEKNALDPPGDDQMNLRATFAAFHTVLSFLSLPGILNRPVGLLQSSF
jgi:hypothetical protein